MKKGRCILICIFCVLLSGCGFFPVVRKPYSFKQEIANVYSIEIVRKLYDTLDPIGEVEVETTLQEDLYDGFMEALVLIDGNYVLEGAAFNFGKYIVRITYFNGEVELISEYNSGYVTPEGILVQEHYWFDHDQFYALLAKYVEIDFESLF